MSESSSAAAAAAAAADNTKIENNSKQTHQTPTLPPLRMTAMSSRLHENMMRELRNRDPYKYYEVVEMMGVGSMGSVCKVKKKASALGGSARKHNIVSNFFVSLFFCSNGSNSNNNKKKKKTMTTTECCWMPAPNSVLPKKSNVLEKEEKEEEEEGREEEDLRSSRSMIKPAGAYTVYYALKSIHLNRLDDDTMVEELKNEIAILRELDHPHIVRPIEMFENNKHLYMVMELCSGGDLYSRDPYTEEQSARIVSSILSAVAYMHDRNVVHRDLKYENIMFANPSPNADIKIIDFGLSKRFAKGTKMSEGVGTIYTMSPQVIEGSYTSKADIWSIGVLAYMLLSSQMPFYGSTRRHVVEKIIRGKFDFKGRRWRAISRQAKEFVSELLRYKPTDRPTAEQAIQGSWLHASFIHRQQQPTEEVMDNVEASMVAYSKYKKMKKLALMVVAHKSTSEEIGFLRRAFQKYDQSKDGRISQDEFKACLTNSTYSDAELEEIFHGVDIDGSGRIRYTEFLAATIEAHGAISEERLAEAFDRLDSDDSGYISVANLRGILGEDIPQPDIEAIIEEADMSNDQRISYDEFLAMWDDHQEEQREQALKTLQQERDMVRNTLIESIQTQKPGVNSSGAWDEEEVHVAKHNNGSSSAVVEKPTSEHSILPFGDSESDLRSSQGGGILQGSSVTSDAVMDMGALEQKETTATSSGTTNGVRWTDV